MNILFLHDAFPAQFGRLGLELADRFGWRCRYLVRHLGRCPGPSAAMLGRLEVQGYEVPDDPVDAPPSPWPTLHGRHLAQCLAVREALRGVEEDPPDLIVGAGGRGAPTLFVREAFDRPIIHYCEYYFARSHRDLTYRLDLPAAEPAPFFPRVINAATLGGLVAADAGYAPTAWQRDSFPSRFRDKIEVHFDGVDERLHAPGPRPTAIAGRSIGGATRVVTFVARGLESIRGFDLFLGVAERVALARPDVLFVVVGDETSYYGWDAFHTEGRSFRDWALARSTIDRSRLIFLGSIGPEALAEVFRASDLHLYLSVPFVASWSLFNAMSTGLIVLGSDVGPVREVIDPGRTGLVAPLFDLDALAEVALAVIDDPAQFAPLGRAARRLIEERYGIEATLPPLRDFFERVASAGPSTRV